MAGADPAAGPLVAGAGGAGGTADPAGVAGGAGTTGAAGVSGSIGAPPDDDRPPCIHDGSEVVIIGDSYINWSTHTLPADLATESGQSWRLYALGGASMGSGGIATLIPDQFEQAVLAGPNIKLVVMDGGGNDIMIPAATWVGGADCKNRADAPNIPVCQDIMTFALEKAEMGMQRMVEVGVRDVVYFFYPEVPEGTILGGLAPNAMLDFAKPRAEALCAGAEAMTNGALRCHFIDLVPVFEGHNPEWFYPTDIHPNPMGSQAMARAIWQRMVDECVGQPESSGCCAP